MEKIEIRYNKKKIFTAIIVLGIGLAGAVSVIFFTNIFTEVETLKWIRLPARLLAATAVVYFVFVIFKKRHRILGATSVITLTPKSIDLKNDGNLSTFNRNEITRIEV